MSVAGLRHLTLEHDSCARVRYESNFPAPRPEGLEAFRVFGRLPDTDARGCTEAGVRKASREETAGEFAATLVSIYGKFAAAA